MGWVGEVGGLQTAKEEDWMMLGCAARRLAAQQWASSNHIWKAEQSRKHKVSEEHLGRAIRWELKI